MTPNFALSLSFDGIRLLHLSAGAWTLVGEVPLDAPDLVRGLAALREAGLARAPEGIRAKVVIPPEQVRYMALPDPEASEEDILDALDGATPYPVAQLVIDCESDGKVMHIAVVSRETLDEAETFAAEYRFGPVSFVALPEPGTFPGEIYFGPTRLAAARAAAEPEIATPAVPAALAGVEVVAPVTADVSAVVQVEDAPELAATLPEVADPLREVANATQADIQTEAVADMVTGAGPDIMAEAVAAPMADEPPFADPAPAEPAPALASEAVAAAEDTAYTTVEAVEAETAPPASAIFAPVVNEPAETFQDRTEDAAQVAQAQDANEAAIRAFAEEAAFDAQVAWQADHAQAIADDQQQPAAVAQTDAARVQTDAPVPQTDGFGTADHAEPHHADASDLAIAFVIDNAASPAAPEGQAPYFPPAAPAAPQTATDLHLTPIHAAPPTPPARHETEVAFATPRAPVAEDTGVVPRIERAAPQTAPMPPAFTPAETFEPARPAFRMTAPVVAAAAEPAMPVFTPAPRPAAEPAAAAPAEQRAHQPAEQPAPQPAEEIVALSRPAVDPLALAADVAPLQPRRSALAAEPRRAARAAQVAKAPARDLRATAGALAALPFNRLPRSVVLTGALVVVLGAVGLLSARFTGNDDTTAALATLSAETAQTVEIDQGQPVSPEEAERFYAQTGVWLRAPRLPVMPRQDEVETLAAAATDDTFATVMSAVLPTGPDIAPDPALPGQPVPPPPGTTFARDARGMILATAEGTLLPNGALVYAGLPTMTPPTRPGTAAPNVAPSAADEAAASVRTRGLRPQARPADLAPAAEPAAAPEDSAAATAAPTDTALNIVRPDTRPRARPATASIAEVAAAPAAGGVALAAFDGPSPRTRPGNITAADPVPPVVNAVPQEDLDATLAALVTANTATATALAVPQAERPNLRPRNFGSVVDTQRAREERAAEQAAAAAAAAAEQQTAAAAAAQQAAQDQAARQAASQAAQAAADQAAAQQQAAAAAAAAAAAEQQAAAQAAAQQAAAQAAAQQAAAQPTGNNRLTAEEQAEAAEEVSTIAAPPSGATTAGVAQAATRSGVINLGQTNLIGVFGAQSNRRALVRLSNGRMVRVGVGDSIESGRVAAIGDSFLNYTQGGQTYTLHVPGG